MSKYKITLTPTGRFFFGGDQKFQVGNTKDKFNDSYIIESRKFPQQTSLLGMLRFLILSNDSAAFNKGTQTISNAQKAEELIGKESFQVGKENKFGKIDNIGPCGLVKGNGKILFPEWMFEKYKDESKKETELKPVDKDCTDYDAKLGIAVTFDNVKEDDIFIQDKRMGINRDITTGKTDDGALYKQIFYRLADGYAFAFEAEVDYDMEKYKGQLVTLGGDNSQFVIGIEEPNPNEEPKVINFIVTLQSDSFIKRDVAESASFAVSDVVPFKCLQIGSVSYNRKNAKPSDYSKKLYLYKAGSIFFFDDKTALKKFTVELESHKDFRQIGYNYYTVK